MKRKSIITSVLVIVLCLGLISGSTFALFTSESKVNIAVTSGKVKVTATLDALKLYSASADTTDVLDPAEVVDANKAGKLTGTFAGTYYYHDRTTEGKFLNGGEAAIVASTETTPAYLNIQRITPGDKVTLNVNITNESNVAIQYRVRVNVLSGLKLYEGLVVKTDGVSLQGVQKVGNWTYKAAGADITSVPVEVYLPLEAGNEYQDLSTSIQITVEAVQGNANTTNDTLNTSVNVEKPVADTAATQGQVITDNDQLVEVSVPAEAFGDEIPNTTTSLSVKIEPQDTTYNLVLTSTQASQSYDLEVLVKTQVGTEDPTTEKYNANNDASATALKIKMFVGTGLTGVKLYHKTTPLTAVATLSAVDALNEYYYDSTEGYITLMTNSFSEYTVVYNKDIAVEKNNTITVYTPTEEENVYNDAEGNIVVINIDETTSEPNVVSGDIIVTVGEEAFAYSAKNYIEEAIRWTNGTEEGINSEYGPFNAAYVALCHAFWKASNGLEDVNTSIVLNSDLSVQGMAYSDIFRSSEDGTFEPYGYTAMKYFADIPNVTLDLNGKKIDFTTQREECEYMSAICVYNANLTIKDSSETGTGTINTHCLSVVTHLGNTILVIEGGKFTTDCVNGNYHGDGVSKGGDFVENETADGYMPGQLMLRGGTFSYDYMCGEGGTPESPALNSNNIPTGISYYLDEIADGYTWVNNNDGTFSVLPRLDVIKKSLQTKADQLNLTLEDYYTEEQDFSTAYYASTLSTYDRYGKIMAKLVDKESGLTYALYEDLKLYLWDTTDYTGDSLTLSNIDGIRATALSYNETIKTLTINCNLEQAIKCMQNNTTIENVVFGSGVTFIPQRFTYRSQIKNVTLPNTVTTIERYAFGESYGLLSIVLPASVTLIDKEVLKSCPVLKTITINGNPSIDGYYLARDCAALEDVYFTGDPTFTGGKYQIFTNSQSGNTSNITVHFINEEVRDKYLAHESGNGNYTETPVVE